MRDDRVDGNLFEKIFLTAREDGVGTLWISVVANTKITCGGGSSRVFNSALKASVVSMCTSSMM